MAAWDKIKAGNLYLYTMDEDADPRGRYIDVPVIALEENSFSLLKREGEYPTWLCLFPNLTTGGLYPRCLTDVTVTDEGKREV